MDILKKIQTGWSIYGMSHGKAFMVQTTCEATLYWSIDT